MGHQTCSDENAQISHISEDHTRKLADFSELPTENPTQIRDSKKSVSAQ